MRPKTRVLVAKRCLDLGVGAAGSLALVLAYPFLALLIKAESPGPVLYSQVRVGVNRRQRGAPADGRVRGEDVGGRPFRIYKFRSMRTDAEAQGPQLAAKGGDPRVTKVGWWLRALHLDELPQFWNVLRGDMSFIGPRPERPHFTVRFATDIPHYGARTLYVKPGITGLAQIVLGYDDSLESVVRKSFYDYSYRASLCSFRSWIRMEAWILFHTVGYLLAPLRRNGEVRDLAGLRRARRLHFFTRVPDKAGEHAAMAWMRTAEGGPPKVVFGDGTAAMRRALEEVDFRGARTLEVCITPARHFDLEDLGLLIDLVQQVKGAGGRVALRGTNPQVSRMLKEIHLDKVVEIKRSPRTILNFLTVDLECWFHAFNLQGRFPPSTWHTLETRIEANTERILRLLDSHRAKATFFVLGWVAERYPDLVRAIDAAGHEIGTHGHYHRLITDMTPAQFEEDLLKSLEVLSRLASRPVRGHRASNFTIVPATFWALEIMARHGLEYDSSIFPIKRDRYGIPHYPNRLPHRLLLKNHQSLWEFPMSTLGVGKKFLPMSGGGYLRLFPHQVTEAFIEARNQKGHPAMVYFHPWELDPDQRRADVGLVKGFQHYVNLHSTEWKLHRLLQKFSFGPVREGLESRRIRALLARNPVAIMDQAAVAGGGGAGEGAQGPLATRA